MTLVVRIQFWNYSSLFTMNRVNFNNFRPSISRVSSIETHTRGRNFVPKVMLRRRPGIGADSLDERTQLVLRSQSETVRSGLTPCSGRYRFWVTSSCLALRGIPRSHCAFVRQPVRSGPDRETYIANPPSSATSRRENFARHLRRWLVRKRAPRGSPRDEDDAGTTSLRENASESEGGGDDARRLCRRRWKA